MTYLGTRETREAREVARLATADEREHRRRCITCIRANRQRTGAQCPEGRQLLDAKREADARLKTERELDKQPIPGQAELFSAEEAQ